MQTASSKLLQSIQCIHGGMDKNNQITWFQKCRCYYQWQRCLLMKIFMWAACVAVNFTKPPVECGWRTYIFHVFLEDLFESLVHDVRNELIWQSLVSKVPWNQPSKTEFLQWLCQVCWWRLIIVQFMVWNT